MSISMQCSCAHTAAKAHINSAGKLGEWALKFKGIWKLESVTRHVEWDALLFPGRYRNLQVNFFVVVEFIICICL